jgi:guanylate kinase
MKQLLIIVSAPSGAGKSTLCDMALRDFPQLMDSISYTTRSARPGESEGHPYYFITPTEFDHLISENFFAEWAIVHGNLYGTSRRQLEDFWNSGHYVIMDVDIQGAANLKALYKDSRSIFIKPPSIEALSRRLSSRAKGKSDDLDLRLRNAEREMKEADKFDYVIINDEVNHAYAEFKKIIAEIFKAE